MTEITKSCESKYNEALSLLSIPTKENIDKAYLMMSKLAAEDKYLPAIKWMANYNENVLGDYKEAAFWYKQSIKTVEPKTEGSKERAAESIASSVPETVTMEPSPQKPESFQHDSVISEAEHGSDSPDNHSKGKRKGPFAGIVIALALLLGIGAWCYFTFFRVKSVELNCNRIELASKDEEKITATVFPGRLQDKVKVRWFTSDPEVATVSEFGTITAVGPGTCAITAKAGSKTASVEVSVYQIEGILLDINDVILMPNESITVKAFVRPNNSSGARLNWTSSDDTVATVDSNGVITAIGKGKCTVAVSAGEKKAFVEVEVSDLTAEDNPTPSPTPKPTATPKPTTTPIPTYTVTLSKEGGSGGTSSVKVSKGSNMPKASAPTRSGYLFKGYYSKKNGEGQQYYDAEMNSVHKWDKDGNGTIYAYWKINRQSFSQKLDVGSYAYTKIVSIEPKYLIYEKNEEWGYAYVCKCKTSVGNTVWICIEVGDYWDNFDDNAGNHVGYWGAEKISFSSAKKINGKVMYADSEMSGLSDKLGVEKILKFTSVSG